MARRQLPFLEIAEESSIGFVVVFDRFAGGEVGGESAI